MKLFYITVLLLAPLGALGAGVLENRYNVVWDSPSQNAHGSMPLGNGDVGINAWVEPSGDLIFYVSKTDAWDENGRLCKIGRVRVSFDPPLPVTNSFRQELKLREGVIEITAGKSRLELWVDANHPVVRLAAQTEFPATCRAAVELWRLRERPFDGSERGIDAAPGIPLVMLPDVIVTSTVPNVVWYLAKLFAAGYKGPVGLQCYSVKGDVTENLKADIAAWKKMLPRIQKPDARP
jgi:alpha-L-fucosidase 2